MGWLLSLQVGGPRDSVLVRNAEAIGLANVYDSTFVLLNFSLLTHLKLCKDFEVDNHIKDFAAKLSLIPSPPPGPLHLVILSFLCSIVTDAFCSSCG